MLAKQVAHMKYILPADNLQSLKARSSASLLNILNQENSESAVIHVTTVIQAGKKKLLY